MAAAAGATALADGTSGGSAGGGLGSGGTGGGAGGGGYARARCTAQQASQAVAVVAEKLGASSERRGSFNDADSAQGRALRPSGSCKEHLGSVAATDFAADEEEVTRPAVEGGKGGRRASSESAVSLTSAVFAAILCES